MIGYDYIMCIHMANRFRNKLIHIYLHADEDNFLKSYSEKNYLSVSELIRGWIHEVMKKEGYSMNEPLYPEPNKREVK